jgi:hypothetical protein
MSAALPPFWSMMIWGLIATVAMTTVLQGAQGLGLSRLSLPFLAGTFFTGDRRWAVIIGFVFYVIGGWVFAFLYFSCSRALAFTRGGSGSVRPPARAFLACGRAADAALHSPADGVRIRRRLHDRQLEPPGFMGLNYGPRTPLTTLAGQALYGAALGGLPQLLVALE